MADYDVQSSETADLVRRVAEGEHIRIHVNGAPVAVLLSEAEYRAFCEWEDRMDCAAADEARAEAEREGTVRWDEVKARAGL